MEIDLTKFIKDSSLKITIKVNAPKNEILGFDESKQAIRVGIAAVPDKNKANKEIIKFFSKLLKKKVKINSGLKSKEKRLSIL